MQTTDIILHLSLIPHIGPVTVGSLLKKIPLAQLSDLYHYTYADFQQLGCTEKNARNLKNGLADMSIFEQEKKLLEQHRIQYITILDTTYPELLKHIYAPPVVLYVKGTPLNHYKNCIATVGSRKANLYAQQAIQMIIPPLVQSDFVILSGGAIGADTMAHKATLKMQGKTVAILGSGLLKPYPLSNRSLFDEIVQNGGSIVSPFSLETAAHPGNFPARNRIIAGISTGTIVVQAAAESGASITAQFALEYGREVFAIPGPINDPLSQGCHRLIQQGAMLVHSAEDILKSLSYDGIQHTSGMPDVIATEQDESIHSTREELPEISDIAEQIVTFCKKPKSSDELLELLQIEIQSLQEALLDLQIQGVIDQQLNGLWYSV